MTFFIGRNQELNKLNDLFRLKKAQIVVVKGRRRIGKSSLITQFAKDKTFLSFSGLAPVKGMSAQNQRDAFAKQFSEQFKLPALTFYDWFF